MSLSVFILLNIYSAAVNSLPETWIPQWRRGLLNLIRPANTFLGIWHSGELFSMCTPIPDYRIQFSVKFEDGTINSWHFCSEQSIWRSESDFQFYLSRYMFAYYKNTNGSINKRCVYLWSSLARFIAKQVNQTHNHPTDVIFVFCKLTPNLDHQQSGSLTCKQSSILFTYHVRSKDLS
jgi:hypothetical protein